MYELNEIKGRYDYSNSNGDFFYEAITCADPAQRCKDFAWLISEVDRLHEVIDEAKKGLQAMLQSTYLT